MWFPTQTSLAVTFVSHLPFSDTATPTAWHSPRDRTSVSKYFVPTRNLHCSRKRCLHQCIVVSNNP